MKCTIENVGFGYDGKLIIGRIWLHDFFLDVYRKEVSLNTEEEFLNYCQEVFDRIPDYFKEVKQ